LTFATILGICFKKEI